MEIEELIVALEAKEMLRAREGVPL